MEVSEQLSLFEVRTPMPVVIVHDDQIVKMRYNVVYRHCWNCVQCGTYRPEDE